MGCGKQHTTNMVSMVFIPNIRIRVRKNSLQEKSIKGK